MESRRYSTSSSRRDSTSSSTPLYPHRQSLLDYRHGQPYMTILPPMSTEEDLLHEDFMAQPATYESYGPFPEQRKRPKIIEALAGLLRKLRRTLGKRR